MPGVAVHHIVFHHLTAVHLFLLVLQYGYLLLFPIAVLEGPVAAIVAGALVASGALDPFVVFGVLVVADLVGDFLYYSLGRWGHVHFLDKLITLLGLTEDRLEPLKEQFHKDDWKFLLVGKTQGLGGIILYFAGVSKMKLKRFFAWNLVGTLPKVFIFEVVGYLFGQSLIQSQKYFDYFSIGFFVFGVVLIFSYLYAKRYLEGTVEGSFSKD